MSEPTPLGGDGAETRIGRRERNKQRTRDAIRVAARELFLERGFDGVSVAEIAQRAGVVEKTVFNHFPTKEDLVYSEMEHWENDMLAAIRQRSDDESVVQAFCRFVQAPSGLLAGTGEDHETLAQVTRLVLDTPALLAREAATIDRYTRSLAEVYADEMELPSDAALPWVAAHALMGVHRALLDQVRRGIAAGRPPRRVANDVRRLARTSCDLLSDGLGQIGRR